MIVQEDAEHRWTDEMAVPGVMEASEFRKSSQWVAVTRKHAGLVVSDSAVLNKFREYCFLDERPAPM